MGKAIADAWHDVAGGADCYHSIKADFFIGESLRNLRNKTGNRLFYAAFKTAGFFLKAFKVQPAVNDATGALSNQKKSDRLVQFFLIFRA